ncbi:MAG: PDZ domain-containing protein [Actinomycetes bacterium]
MRRRSAALLTSAGLTVVFAGAMSVLPVPYVSLSPGPVFNALGDIQGKPVVAVSGANTYPTSGQLDATTVYETGGPGSRLSLLDALRGWVDPAVAVVPSELLHPKDETQQDAEQQGAEQMSFSQQDAVAAALRYLGKPVHRVVQVQSVLSGSPADGVLKPADRILRVDGTRVHSPDQVRRLISSRKPGDAVTLTVVRGDKRMTFDVTTEQSPDDPGRAVIGVIPAEGYISPIDVKITLANVGGPSAGLVFALAVIDKLTPGSLVGDAPVAGTGTITADGKVGAIGGIEQKMHGARQEGAQFFLAPGDNCSDVVGAVPDGLQVVRVDTLKDAVTALESISSGDTANLPSCAA